MRLVNWTQECTEENDAKENLPEKCEFKGNRLEKPGNCMFPFDAPCVPSALIFLVNERAQSLEELQRNLQRQETQPVCGEPADKERVHSARNFLETWYMIHSPTKRDLNNWSWDCNSSMSFSPIHLLKASLIACLCNFMLLGSDFTS